jgi:hypothetical protein
MDNIQNHTNISALTSTTAAAAGDVIAIKAALETDLTALAAAVAGGSTGADALTTSGALQTVTTTDAQRADKSPYNTYVYTGLPAGPISNPGELAIEAALRPADGDWLFFVTVNLKTGETKFSVTLTEHERAAQEFYAWLRENPEWKD